MATIEQLEQGLKAAYSSGKTDYARVLAAEIMKARQDPANLIPGSVIPETIQQAPEPTMVDQAIGLGEAGLTLATGATGGALGMIGGTLKGLAEQILSGQFGTPQAQRAVEQAASSGAQALTYAPRTQAGQQQTQALGQFMGEVLPPVIPALAAPGQILQTARTAAPSALAATQIGGGQAMQLAQRAAAPVQRVAGQIQRAATSDSGLPPVSAGRSAGAAATPLETQRASEAAMAGLKLTEGETRRSTELLAWENEKAKTPEFQAPFLERQQQNNRAALGKFEQLIDDTGTETGDLSNTGIKVVDTLLKGYGDEKAKTKAMYQAFRESPEAQMPVDATPVMDFINSQPKGVSGITGVTDVARQNAVSLGIATADDAGQLIATPQTTLGQLEAFRQSVSAIGAASPNDKRLVSLLKRNVDFAGDPVGGSITRAMRAQRQRQAQKYENRAIIARLVQDKRNSDDPQVPIEEVFQKTILSARPSEIQHIKRVMLTIGDDAGKQAWKDLQGATLRHLADQAESGIGVDNLPVISGAKLDKTIRSLDKNGKLDLVLGVKAAEEVRNLNQVLKYIQSTPPLTSINNSGTARTVMALMAESALTGAATGIPLPVVQGMKMIRDQIKDKKIKARITKSLNYQPTSSF